MIDTYGLPWKFEFKAPGGIPHIVDFNDIEDNNPLLYMKDDVACSTHVWTAREIAAYVNEGSWEITEIMEPDDGPLPEVGDLI